MPHLRWPLAVATLLLACLLPSSAFAALDVRRTGNALTVIGATAGDTQIQIGEDDDVVYVSGSEVAVGTTTPGTCVDQGDYVECGAAPLTGLSVTLSGPGDDHLEFSDEALTTTAAVTVNTGPGDDELLFYGEPSINADLGAGNDSASTGSGADSIHGGPGNDTFALGTGNDEAFGDEGNDRFDAESSPDGADSFDGGPDSQTTAKLGSGDTISYVERASAIQVTLPSDANSTPAGNNGAAAENDRLAHVENAIGSDPQTVGAATSTLTGNERANYLGSGWGDDNLIGAGGNDYLAGDVGRDGYEGGDGDDVIDARSRFRSRSGASTTLWYEDVDAKISCGGGQDAVRRDPEDPDGAACEHQAPYLLETPHILGGAETGSRLSVERGLTFGEADTPLTSWYSCIAGRVPEELADLPEDGNDDCALVSTDESYFPDQYDVGHVFFARVELAWSYGEGAVAFTPLFGPIKPGSGGSPGGPGTVPRGTGPGPGGLAGSPDFLQRASVQAQRQLGAGSIVSNISLGAGTALFEAPITKGGIVVLKGTIVPSITGIACEKNCTAAITGSIILVPKSKRAKRSSADSTYASTVATAASAKAKYKTVKLKPQSVRVVAGGLGVVKLNATSAHRRLIKRARKAKLTLAYALTYADGSVRKAKKSYLVKVR